MIDIREVKHQIEELNPLILNITNLVTMDFMANTLLALGASPVMSNDTSDALDLLQISKAININIGTLDDNFLELVLTVAKTNNKIKPLILDPVGVGASMIRSQASTTLLPHCTILRGNASEINAIHNNSKPKGVDACIPSESALDNGLLLSQQENIIVAISGETDYIIANKLYNPCPFGNFLMPKITGMGCVLSSVIAVFNCVETDPFKATLLAHLYYSLCGELAYKKQNSLGYFKNHFIDMIYQPDYDYIQNKINSLELPRNI